MRINFIVFHAGLAGGTRVTAEYAKRLKQRGHTVKIVSTPRPAPSFGKKMKVFLKGNGWPVHERLIQSHVDRSGVEHHVIDRFRPIADGDVPDADVVIASWWQAVQWVAQLSPNKGAKVYFLQHDDRVMSPNPELSRQVEATWRLPMHRIAVAQWIADLLKSEIGESVDVVKNSVDIDLFHAPPREKQAIPTIGLMYCTARFKGMDIAMSAISKALVVVPNLRVVAYGNGDPTTELPMPPGTEYHRQPPQERIREIYAKCDAWLFASRCEGFGLPILEAMACRTPVIGTPAGAAPTLLEKGGGILVKPESPSDMAAAIERIAKMDNKQWRSLSDAAYEIATGYTWDDATDLFEVALKRAVSGNGREQALVS